MWRFTAVSIHLQHVSHVVNPLGQVLLAAGCHVVRAPVAGAIVGPYGEQMTQLGGLYRGQLITVDQLCAAAEHDASTLAFQSVVDVVAQLR